MKTQQLISKSRIKRIRAQGYFKCTDLEVSELAFGNRFAYILCSIILIIGVSTASIPILSTMLIIAFLGVILPNHPFDYIYNRILSSPMGKPKLPPRSKQLKFACSIATSFLIATVYLFYSEYTSSGYIVGTILITSAVLVSSTDICIPSIVYNIIFKIKKE